MRVRFSHLLFSHKFDFLTDEADVGHCELTFQRNLLTTTLERRRALRENLSGKQKMCLTLETKSDASIFSVR